MQNVSYKTLFILFYSNKGNENKSKQLINSLENFIYCKTANHVNFMQPMLISCPYYFYKKNAKIFTSRNFAMSGIFGK